MVDKTLARLGGGILCALTLASATVAGQAPVSYVLVLATVDGSFGPNLHPAAVDCATLRATATAPPSRENPPCNLRRDIGRLSASGIPIQQLSGMLSDHTGFRITDRTGLSGLYDWDLTWTPENLRGHAPERFQQVDANGPSVFAAVETQLGLRLIPAN